LDKVEGKKFKKIKIQIKNVDVPVAGEITHYLFEMLDNQELQSISIDEVKKSKNCIDFIIGVVVGFVVTYFAGKIVDIPYNHTINKIRSMLQKWKNPKNGSLDFFMDDDTIE